MLQTRTSSRHQNMQEANKQYMLHWFQQPIPAKDPAAGWSEPANFT